MTRRPRSIAFGSTLGYLGAVALASLAILVLASGCAKRPQMTVASAPPPVVAPPAPPAPSPAPPAVAESPAPPPAPATPPAEAPSPPAPPAVVKESPREAPAAPVAERPARPPHPPREFMANDALKTIHFDFDKADIRTGDAEVLLASAKWLNDNPDQLVLIEGHCDSRGTNEYNLALGERRARVAMSFFMAHGVAANRITVVSYGEERPLCGEETEECWARNRRGMFLTRPRP